MTTTTADPTRQEAGTPTAVARTERLLAGWSAVGFATIVLAGNVIAGSEPAMDAPGAEVVRFLADDRTTAVLGTASFAVAAPLVVVFAAAFYGRLSRVAAPDDRVFARVGSLGAALLLVSFAAVVVPRIVLLGGGTELAEDPAFAGLLWRLGNAAFLLNVIPVCLAVFGFGIAGARAGLLPSWFRYLAVVAGVGGLVAPVFSVAALEGSTALLGPSLVTFLSWMLLLYLAGIRQLRSAD